MILEGPEGRLELTVVRYQFPEQTEDWWDANWLIAQGRVRLKGRGWVFQDPCITTFEARSLADWLEAVSRGDAAKPYLALVEPNLQFDRKAEDRLRVSFALESAPPWAKRGEDWTKYGFEVPVGPVLARAAGELRVQLASFPVRGRPEAANG